MNRIQIRNKFKAEGEYIGRPTPLGNPFPLEKHPNIWVERERRVVIIHKYEKWLRDNLHQPKIAAELDRLQMIFESRGELTLTCYCFPELCHGGVVRMVLEERMK